MTCTACHEPPFALAILGEATRIAPARRKSSDGICPSAEHMRQNPNSDHNPSGARCYGHAVDISQSTPGAPFWLPSYGVFDAHAYGLRIAERMKAGTETRVEYLVSNYGHGDVIFNPSVSMTWRPNSGTGNEHESHLHVSFTAAAEQSTAAFFGSIQAPAPPPKPLPVPPNVETTIEEENVKQSDISMRLDVHGNGYVDVPATKAVEVHSVLLIGPPDPAVTHAYSPIPRVALTIGHDSGLARVIVEGGAPLAPATVRVVHE